MPAKSIFGGFTFHVRLTKLLSLMKAESCTNGLYTTATKVFGRSFEHWGKPNLQRFEKLLHEVIVDKKSDHISFLLKAGLPADFKVGKFRLFHLIVKHSLLDPMHQLISNKAKVDSKIMEAAYASKRNDIFMELMNHAGPSEHFKLIPLLVKNNDITYLNHSASKIGFSQNKLIDKEVVGKYWGYVLLSAYKAGVKDIFFKAKSNNPSYESVIGELTHLLILRQDFSFVDDILANCIKTREIELVMLKVAINRGSFDLIQYLDKVGVDFTEYTRLKTLIQECDKASDSSVKLDLVQKIIRLGYLQAKSKDELESFEESVVQIHDGMGLMPVRLSKSTKETISVFVSKIHERVHEYVSIAKVDKEFAEENFVSKMKER